MREILFRGKDADTGEWREGYLYVEDAQLVGMLVAGQVPPEPTYWIIFKNPRYVPDWSLPWQYCKANVDPATIGQFTGRLDNQGKRIFEGDLVEWDGKSMDTYEIIYGEDASFFGVPVNGKLGRTAGESLSLLNAELSIAVVGNVWDAAQAGEDKG